MLRADPGTGELTPATGEPGDAPDGVIYKACGDRPASVCPPCAERYRQDTWQLIAAGLRGGKGVPADVVGHPAVLLTLTAPSFGLVHTRRTASTGRVLPCRPRRKPALCLHGRDLRCGRHHDQDEAVLGTVRECYRVLSLVLRSAVQARLLAITCDGVRLPPKRRQDEPVTLSREEVTGKLLPEIPDRYRALVATSAYTGLRWGECVGRYWEVVDLDARRLRVVRVL